MCIYVHICKWQSNLQVNGMRTSKFQIGMCFMVMDQWLLSQNLAYVINYMVCTYAVFILQPLKFFYEKNCKKCLLVSVDKANGKTQSSHPHIYLKDVVYICS